MAVGEVDPPWSSLDPAVEEALRVGPFERALRVAIEHSGYTLARLEYHLTQRNRPVGRSTLSYWQRGQRRPEQPDSLNALDALEEVLGLPPASLKSLLGPRKPRGRWIGYRGAGLDWSEIWGPGDDIRRLIAIDSRRSNDKLLDVAVTETFHIGSDRRMHWLETQSVTRAREGGADRMMVLLNTETDLDASRVRLSHMTNCRIGRRRVVESNNFVAFEILFDRALPDGETHLFSYRIDLEAGFLSQEERRAQGVEIVESVDGSRGFRRPVHSYVLAARFASDVLPVRTYQVRAGRASANDQLVKDLTLDAFGTTHIAIQDVKPGFHGIHWDWE